MNEPQAPAPDPMESALAAMETKLFGADEEPSAEPEAAPETQPDGDETPAEPADDLVEIAVDDGESYRVPQKLKDAFLRRDDYTKKVQEVAELRKQAVLNRQAQQAAEHFEQAIAPERNQYQQMAAEIARYDAINWAELDTDTLVKAKHARDTLREKMGAIEQSMRAKGQQFMQWREAQKRQATEHGIQYLKATIPSWGTEHMTEAAKQATEIGYTEAEIQDVYDPRFVKALWKAAQYDKITSNKGAALATAAKAPPVIKPGSSDPAMKARMENVRWAKDMKNAPTDAAKKAIAEKRMARFFGG